MQRIILWELRNVKNCILGATKCKELELRNVKNCIVGAANCEELYCGSYER